VQDAVGSDAEAREVLTDFTVLFASMREGRHTLNETRNLAVNLLNDVAPAAIEEFLTLFDACVMADAWAGLVNSETGEELNMCSDQFFFAASEPLAGEEQPGRGAEGDLEEGRGASPSRAHMSETVRPSGRTNGGGRRAAALAADAGATACTLAGVGHKPEGKTKDWLHVAKALVPYGRGACAIWFTIINISVIIGVFAYMAGDYAMWVRTHHDFFLDSSESGRDAGTRAERQVYYDV
jgi:hypothetical protein